MTNEQSKQFQQAIDLARSAQVTFKIQVQEWKNFLLRGSDTAAYEKYKNGFIKEGQETQAKLKQLKGVLQDLGLPLAGVDEALSSHEQLQVKYTSAMAHYDAANADASAHAVDKMVKGIDRAPTAQIDTIVADVLKVSSERHEATEVATHAGYTQSLWMLGAFMSAALCLGTIGSVVILRGITAPLHRVVDVATCVPALKSMVAMKPARSWPQ